MNQQLDNKSRTAAVVYLLLFVFLALRVGGAVSHYCFDGMEPPVSIHFDNLSGHVDHEDEAGHTDVEKQVLSDNLVSKFFDVDSLILVVSLFLLSLLSLSQGRLNFLYVCKKSNDLKDFLPPLRAPPLAS